MRKHAELFLFCLIEWGKKSFSDVWSSISIFSLFHYQQCFNFKFLFHFLFYFLSHFVQLISIHRRGSMLYHWISRFPFYNPFIPFRNYLKFIFVNTLVCLHAPLHAQYIRNETKEHSSEMAKNFAYNYSHSIRSTVKFIYVCVCNAFSWVISQPTTFYYCFFSTS